MPRKKGRSAAILFVIGSGSKWQNSELMDQREQYTGEELYTALIQEFEKGRKED